MPAGNMLGVDVARLDVASFLALCRNGWLLLSLLWLLGLMRVKRPWWLLLGVFAANAYLWGITNYPLQRIYALAAHGDRLGNLALCQVVAAGNSPLRTAQVGQLHFEPFWGLFVAAVSGWSPDRVLRLYPFLSLGTALAFAVALYLGLKDPSSGPESWSAWERAFVAGFATLLSSSPLDFTATYRVPWAMTFLLKPNHALALALFPVFLRVFCRIRGWRGRLLVGVLLHVLGWAFVLHMVYVCFGLLVFVLLSRLERRADFKRDLLDAFVVIGVNVLVVSPYLYMLLVGYPFLEPSPRMTIHVASPHLLEVTLKVGWVFFLGIWGLIVARRRGDRLGRVWVAQVLGAFIIWGLYEVLSLIQMARERDEIYYWIRFLTAASAGIGAWDLAGRCWAWLKLHPAPARQAAAVVLLAFPWSLPYWWNPALMDSYFTVAIPPIPEAIRLPTDFFRESTDPKAVVAGDHDFVRYVAAFGARRVLYAPLLLHAPKDLARRVRLEEMLVRGTEGNEVRAALAHYHVAYLVVTPSLLAQYPGVSLKDLEKRTQLAEVFLSGSPKQDFLAIFRIEPSAEASPKGKT